MNIFNYSGSATYNKLTHISSFSSVGIVERIPHLYNIVREKEIYDIVCHNYSAKLFEYYDTLDITSNKKSLHLITYYLRNIFMIEFVRSHH